MKITKQKLVKIIKEELEAALEEGDETDFDEASYDDYYAAAKLEDATDEQADAYAVRMMAKLMR